MSIKRKEDVFMDKKQAEKEMDYRIGKIVLATMVHEELITKEEYEAVRQYLMSKIKPLMGSLEPKRIVTIIKAKQQSNIALPDKSVKSVPQLMSASARAAKSN